MASTLLARVHNPGDGPRPEPAPMAATRLARDTPRTTPASQPKCARPDINRFLPELGYATPATECATSVRTPTTRPPGLTLHRV